MKDDNRARLSKHIKVFICVLLALGIYPTVLLVADPSTALKIFIVVNVPLLIAVGMYLSNWFDDV